VTRWSAAPARGADGPDRGGEERGAEEEQAQAAAAAGDSLTVAAWTIVSRVTGVARFACIGAVLGPTFFGNTYQFTNSLPNLVYYGFLAGSLFSSLLVPALVRHIDAGDRRASERVAGGFLGMSLVALALIAPVAITIGPFLLRFASAGVASHLVSAAQVSIARLLIIMFIPQIFFYGVVGTATAVMNSRQRFALAAGAPAVENLGTIAVLVLTAVIYGTGTSLANVPPGEMLLLGLGSTGAVALHAATQWWGAHRAGVLLVPRAGWRDAEVRVVIRRALPSLAQAGLVALQVLTLLVVANRLPGGVVAFQIALNFYYLAIALGATPVALSLLPRLARMHLDGDVTAFRDTLVRGLALGFFITIPAAVGYLVLAVPLAHAISFGRMDGAAAVTMVAVSLAALSLAVVGQTAFMIATYASYARKDTRSPLISMLLQAVVCLGLVPIALFTHGWHVLLVLGLALSVAVTAAACHLTARLWRKLSGRGSQRLAPSLVKITAGAVIMAGPAWLVATSVPERLGRPLGPRAGILAGAAVGAVIYLGLQAMWRTPEFGWLADGLGHLRGKARRAVAAGAAARPTAGGVPAAAAATAGPAGPQRPARRPQWPAWRPRPRAALSPALPWRGRGLRIGSSRWVAALAVAGAAGLGGMCVLRPLLTLAAVLGMALVACVWAWPALGAYLILALTPLVAGINRGSALPIVRPNEAIALLVGGTLAARGVVRLRSGHMPKIRLGQVEVALLLMAVTSSLLPMLWMTLRQVPISKDDILYAFVLWKFLGLYVIIRACVSTDRQVRRCMWIMAGAACAVAFLAILQSLGLFGVPGLLVKYYAPFGYTNAFAARGSSTLGLPAATADLAIVNLAVVAGLWTRYRRHRPLLAAAAGLLVMGALAAGEFSSAIGLVVGVVCVAIAIRNPRLLWAFAPAALIGGYALRPVIARRLSGFQSASGLPVSWTGRLQNLQTYFWPKLFSNWNFLFGVEPSARIPVASQATGYVWIESGYTWLLWAGGIPLLASFVFLVYAAARRGLLAARGPSPARSVAGTALFAAIIVITVLMIFDPHLTYRGSGDAFFCLLALAAAGKGTPLPRGVPVTRHLRVAPAQGVSLVARPGQPPGAPGSHQPVPMLVTEARE
jgi:murein biosynthesis integral membrane protein MurJ